MPTENRSSNTEQMVSVPREWVENYAGLLEERCAYEASERVQAVLAQPPAQHKGEPVAVLYADGSVLTKAECGDAFETCCKVETPLYTHADAGEVERLRAELESVKSSRDAFAQNAIDLRAQLAERDALLKRQPSFINALETFEADDGTFVRLSDVLGAVAASAEPRAAADDLADPGEVERLREQVNCANQDKTAAAVMMQRMAEQQLAEQDALLRDINKRHSSGVDFDLPADLAARVAAVCATSAGPSNDLCAEGAHEFVPFRSKCVKCDEPYNAEPKSCGACANGCINGCQLEKDSPPSDAGITASVEPSAPDGLEGVEDLARRIAARVKARAALKRKP